MISDSFAKQYEKLASWAGSAQQDGWLDRQVLQCLQQIEHQSVDTLFYTKHRPLIVAFFGGTGVGKSSLINRLAGETIAKVGTLRPTSHEVTLYLHADFKPSRLPAELPVSRTRIATHHHEQRYLVAWLDLPDIDSTEEENRHLVDEWLPYIDWLVYVVSPERYKDDVGWRYLHARSHRHGWLFVMNHWDEGSSEQVEDFRQRLLAEGFTNPHVLRTSCIPAEGIEDDFAQLELIIQGAIKEYGLEILQQLGVQAHFDDLLACISQFQEKICVGAQWQQAETVWQATMKQQLQNLRNRMQVNARAFTQQSLSPSGEERKLSAIWKKNKSKKQPETFELIEAIWTKRCENQLQDMHAVLLGGLQRQGLPATPFEKSLEPLDKKVAENIRTVLEDSITAALSRPGTPLGRLAYKVTGWLSWLLPLVAALWAIYHAVIGFQAGIEGEREFFGVDFVVHAAALIGLLWLVPQLIHFKLRPDLASATCQGITNGILAGRGLVADLYQELWQTVQKAWRERFRELHDIKEAIEQLQIRAKNYPEDFVRRPENRSIKKCAKNL